MPLPFDWRKAQEVASAGISGTAQGIGQLLMSKYLRGEEQKTWEERRGVEEEERMREEERKETRRQAELDKAFAQNKELAETNARFQAEIETNKGDPYRMDLYKKVMSGQATPDEMAIITALDQIEAKQASLTPLDTNDKQFLSSIRQIYPTIVASVYTQEFTGNKILKDAETELLRAETMAKYYSAQTRRIEEEPGRKAEEEKEKKAKEAEKRGEEIDKEIAKIQEDINKITESKDYQTAVALKKSGALKSIKGKADPGTQRTLGRLDAWDTSIAGYKTRQEELRKKKIEKVAGTEVKAGTKETVTIDGEEREMIVGKIYTAPDGRKFVYLGNGQAMIIVE